MKTIRENKKGLLLFLLVIVLLLGLNLASILYNQANRFVYEEHLSDMAITIDDRPVTLRELGYYVYTVEDFVQKQALLYNPDNPTDYWNTYFSAGNSSKHVSAMAKETVYETCICDHVYESMALAEDYELTQAEKQQGEEKAKEFLKGLTQKQLDKTGLSLELVTEIEQRKILVARFAADYIKKADLRGYSGEVEQLLSSSGSYYKEKILSQHKVEYDTHIRNELKMGHVTIL